MAWMRMPGQTWPGAAASFLGMWVVMMVAMMLPSLVPMLWRYRQAVGRTGDPRLGRLTTQAWKFRNLSSNLIMRRLNNPCPWHQRPRSIAIKSGNSARRHARQGRLSKSPRTSPWSSASSRTPEPIDRPENSCRWSSRGELRSKRCAARHFFTMKKPNG